MPTSTPILVCYISAVMFIAGHALFWLEFTRPTKRLEWLNIFLANALMLLTSFLVITDVGPIQKTVYYSIADYGFHFFGIMTGVSLCLHFIQKIDIFRYFRRNMVDFDG